MRGRRGQFYLIAAVIIIIVVVGFITIFNYSRRSGSVQLYDLGEELGIESQNVLDYGSAISGAEWDNLLDGFVNTYVDYAGEGKDLYFIFGSGSALEVRAYEDLQDVSEDYSITTGEGKVSIVIDEVTYQFDLSVEEVFYFVISQEIEGEKYVVTG